MTSRADDPEAVLNFCRKIADDLRVIPYHGRHIEVEIDERDLRGGEKNWQWVRRGVPIRLEIGQRDMAADSVVHGKTRSRAQGQADHRTNSLCVSSAMTILEEIQSNLYDQALAIPRNTLVRNRLRRRLSCVLCPAQRRTNTAPRRVRVGTLLR